MYRTRIHLLSDGASRNQLSAQLSEEHSLFLSLGRAREGGSLHHAHLLLRALYTQVYLAQTDGQSFFAIMMPAVTPTAAARARCTTPN
jgi:hypothetical protein